MSAQTDYLRKMADALYLELPEAVADDVVPRVLEAAQRIDDFREIPARMLKHGWGVQDGGALREVLRRMDDLDES